MRHCLMKAKERCMIRLDQLMAASQASILVPRPQASILGPQMQDFRAFSDKADITMVFKGSKVASTGSTRAKAILAASKTYSRTYLERRLPKEEQPKHMALLSWRWKFPFLKQLMAAQRYIFINEEHRIYEINNLLIL